VDGNADMIWLVEAKDAAKIPSFCRPGFPRLLESTGFKKKIPGNFWKF